MKSMQWKGGRALGKGGGAGHGVDSIGREKLSPIVTLSNLLPLPSSEV